MPVSRRPRLHRCVPPRLRLAGAGFALLLAAPPAAADLRERFERFERWHGFGWGDGYHSCYDPGPRPFADMPPWPYASDAARRGRCHQCSPAAARPTFYDRFDAGSIAPESSVLGSPGSDVHGAARPADDEADSSDAPPPAEPVETPEAVEAPGTVAAPEPEFAPAERSAVAAGRSGDSRPRPRIVGLHSTGPRH